MSEGVAADTPAPRVRAGKSASPLAMCFQARAYTPQMGLNWLQDRGFISDLCVTVADVAPVDAARVAARFRAYWGSLSPSPSRPLSPSA